MSEKKDALMVQILFATARGAGGMRISREASAWLYERYLPWLTTTRPELGASPVAAWEEKGKGFLARFKEIGEHAHVHAQADGGHELTVEDVFQAAYQVEGEAPCPFCPLWPPPSGLASEVPLQDAVFGQIVFAVARGAEGMRISLAAGGWLYDRYAPWLTAVKPELCESPLEVWETMGKGFLARFREIGEGARAVASGGELSPEDLALSAFSVEEEAPCPWCPTPPPSAAEDVPAIFHTSHDHGLQQVVFPS